jgi:hypothetical protein
MTDPQVLRPLERRVIRLMHEGVATPEIARRFRRSPSFIERVARYTNLPRRRAVPRPAGLRPIERRVLKWRDLGADHADIGRRFHRGPGHIERIEELARYKLRAG